MLYFGPLRPYSSLEFRASPPQSRERKGGGHARNAGHFKCCAVREIQMSRENFRATHDVSREKSRATHEVSREKFRGTLEVSRGTAGHFKCPAENSKYFQDRDSRKENFEMFEDFFRQRLRTGI